MRSMVSRLLWWSLVVAAVGCGGPDRPPDTAPSAVGDPVDVTLPLLPRGNLTLSSLRGKPVVLALFATWDLRSQAEAAMMQQLHERRQEEVSVVSVALGPLGAKGLPMIRTFAEVMGLTYPVMLAEPDDATLAAALGRTTRVPRTLLLDAHGRVLLDMTGQTDFPKLIKVLDKLRR